MHRALELPLGDYWGLYLRVSFTFVTIRTGITLPQGHVVNLFVFLVRAYII